MKDDWILKAVPYFIGLIFVLTIGSIVLTGVLGYRAATEVSKDGGAGIGHFIGEILRGVDEGRKPIAP